MPRFYSGKQLNEPSINRYLEVSWGSLGKNRWDLGKRKTNAEQIFGSGFHWEILEHEKKLI